MNTIKVKVSFKNGTCTTTGITLVAGDYNSTEIKLTMDDSKGKNVFEMIDPNGNLVYLHDINSDVIPLYTFVDTIVEHENNKYVVYTKDQNDFYYNGDLNKLYSSNWNEISNFDLNDYTKVQHKASLFMEKGTYKFEISKYYEDSKLTSASGSIKVKKEEIKIGDEIVTPYLPVFDELLNRIQEQVSSIENLNIDAVKEGNTTFVTITHKDGTSSLLEIKDGSVGPEGKAFTYSDFTPEQLEGLKGPKGNDGKASSIRIGTVTTVSSEIPAEVTNVGTESEAVFDFKIPKGETGASGGGNIDDVLVNNVSTLDGKIAKLNFKTVNNQSVFGTGNIHIEGGSGDSNLVIINTSDSDETVIEKLLSCIDDNVYHGFLIKTPVLVDDQYNEDDYRNSSAYHLANVFRAIDQETYSFMFVDDYYYACYYYVNINTHELEKDSGTETISADRISDSSSTKKLVTNNEKMIWNSKQDALESGTNIKTINNESVLGSGNINVSIPASSSTTLGGVKVRFDGSTLYIRNDGQDA